MTGLCLGQYSEDGVMKCATTVPWWAVVIGAAILMTPAILFDRRQ